MSLSVNDLNSSLGASSISADMVSGMAASGKLTSTSQGAGTDEEMMSACEEFEVYLLQKMYQSVAENMVKSGQGLGIAQTLYESMARNAGIIPAEGTNTEQ